MADDNKFPLGPFALLAGLLTLLSFGSRRNIATRESQQSTGPLPAKRLSACNAIGVLIALSQPVVIERFLQTVIIRHQPSWPAETQIAVSLIDQLYSDQVVQDTLDLIYAHNIQFKNENGIPTITTNNNAHPKNVERQLNVTLNRMQTLGLLLHLGTLKKEDLRGLRYEIIEVGRNKAVREYLDFLNHDYQRSSGVAHDHFGYLKELYLTFEYEASEQQEFQKYKFNYPPGTF